MSELHSFDGGEEKEITHGIFKNQIQVFLKV